MLKVTPNVPVMNEYKFVSNPRVRLLYALYALALLDVTPSGVTRESRVDVTRVDWTINLNLSNLFRPYLSWKNTSTDIILAYAYYLSLHHKTCVLQ